MIFLCFGGKRVRRFCGCYSGSLDSIIVVQASFTRSFCVAWTDYQRFLAFKHCLSNVTTVTLRQFLDTMLIHFTHQQLYKILLFSFVNFGSVYISLRSREMKTTVRI